MERRTSRIRQHLVGAEECAQHEAAQAQRDAVDEWRQGIAITRFRLDGRQFPSGNRFGPLIDGDGRFAGGSKIARPVRIPEGRDHPAATTNRDDGDRGGSIHTAGAAANGKEGVGTHRDAPAEQPAGEGIEDAYEERWASGTFLVPRWRSIDLRW